MSELTNIAMTNLLKELDLEPTFEKLNRHALVASIAAGLYPCYMVLGGFSLACIPVDLADGDRPSLENERTKLTGPQTAYVNNRCSEDDDLISMKIYASAMLAIGILFLVSSRFWLYIDGIAESLKRFAKARQLTDESILTIYEKKAMCSKILKVDGENTDPHRTMREICLLVTVRGPGEKLFKLYLLRSSLLLLLLVFYTIMVIILFRSVWEMGKIFTCRIKEFSSVTSTNETSLDSFICTINEAETISILMAIFCVLMHIQYFAVGYSLHVLRKAQKYNKYKSVSLELLLLLSHHSGKCKQLEELVHYLYSKKYESDVLGKAKDIIRNGDYQLIQIVGMIFGPTSKFIDCLNQSFGTDDDFPAETYIEVMKATEYSAKDNCTLALAKKLIEAKKWELFVYLIGNWRVEKQQTGISLCVRLRALATKLANKCKQVFYRIRNWGCSVCLRALATKVANKCSIAFYRIGNWIVRKEKQPRIPSLESLGLPKENVESDLPSILFYAFEEPHLSGRNKLAAAKFLCQKKIFSDLKIIKPGEQEIKLEKYLKESYPEEAKNIVSILDIELEEAQPVTRATGDGSVRYHLLNDSEC